MKRLVMLAALLLFQSCKDPLDFEPGDPTKPDPPAAPILLSPSDGYNTERYVYPQDVECEWKAVTQAEFYQVVVFSDSMLHDLADSAGRARTTSQVFSLGFGKYFWRVRAASRAWNNYTDWSSTWTFIIPSPTR